MRTWLFDTLAADEELAGCFGLDTEVMGRQIYPRESQTKTPPLPMIIYGLGNATNEDLSEDPDHQAFRQFFQVWLHDEPADFSRIDSALPVVKRILTTSDLPPEISQIRWLEDSQEFGNETYGSIFRYLRFQAIISKGVTLS